MDYELLYKILFGSGSVGGICWVIYKIWDSYINRNKHRELTIKKDNDGSYDLTAKGLSEGEINNIVRTLPKKTAKTPLQLIKRDQNK